MANSNPEFIYPETGDIRFPHRGTYVAYLCSSEADAFKVVKSCRDTFVTERERIKDYLSARLWLILTRVGIWVAFRVPKGGTVKESMQAISQGVFFADVPVMGKLEGTRLDTLGCSPMSPYLECDLVCDHCLALPSKREVNLSESYKKGTLCYA